MTVLNGVACRPHDIELCDVGLGIDARVTDVVRLGFEVRVVVQTSSGESSWVQLTHAEAQRRSPFIGEHVSLRVRTTADLFR
jgi:hypothetical protein